ncbi:hypothetical protein FBEOM_7894 [Fusarium beomiforme]|uniref:JmjC domain-containing protein n=1 Tax=Fusarium beomiforme TaxID=44412 RepID=A0A9P5AGV4_9HYPO|nr:hypothetical protein FBEOM_7894 [Fusarium beomiforme]
MNPSNDVEAYPQAKAKANKMRKLDNPTEGEEEMMKRIRGIRHTAVACQMTWADLISQVIEQHRAYKWVPAAPRARISKPFRALHCTLRNGIPQTGPQTRSQIAEQRKNPATELLVTASAGMDGLDGQLQVIILKLEDAQTQAQNLSNEQVTHEARNRLQMDSRPEISCEQHISTQLGTSEQEISSQSQASETSSSQPAETSDGQQPAGSEDVTMTGSPNDGGHDTTAHGAADEPTTPSPSNQSARVDPNARLEGRSFARSHSAMTESSIFTAADTSPAGSVATHITWPESSGRLSDEDEPMLDVDDTRDSAQKRQHCPGGLNRITDPCSGQDPATDDKASSPDAQSSVSDGRTDQPTQSPGVSNGPSSPEPQSPTACAEADRSPRSSASPPPTVDGDTRPNEMSHADDDFTQVMESAMDIFCAATEKPPMQAHPSGSGDEQHTDDQQTESPSASPTSEGSDSASGGAGRDIGPNTPPLIQFTPSQTSRSCPPPPTNTLTSADMERLVPKLAEMERDGDEQHFSVPLRNVDLAYMQKMVKTTDKKWQTTSTRYEAGPKDEGYARIFVSSSRPPINWEGFTAECQRPTLPEIEDIFEKVAFNPPKEDIAYYTGNLDILPDERLDPGPEITGNPELEDLHRPYQHIGGPGSGCRTHGEDFKNLRSYNEVYFGSGYKLWLAIEQHHIAKFDAFVKANWECCECDQFLSHLSLLLAPSRLRNAGIDYVVAAVGRGEAFYTLPGQQHAIINIGYCAAQSINYVPPGEKIDFSKATACKADGMYAVIQKHGKITASLQELAQATNKRKAHHQLSKNASTKVTRTNTAAERELAEIEKSLAGIPYRQIRINRRHPSTAELKVFRQVAAVRSTMAVQQFITLVKDWKNIEATVHIDKTKDKLNQSVESVKIFEDRTKLSKFALRLTQMKLAREADKVKGPIQRQLKPGFLDDLAAGHGMTKDKLKDHIQKGRQWNAVCKSLDGLLPFILLDSRNPFEIKKQDWTTLCHEEFTADAFRKLLDDDYMRNLCQAGRVFEERMLEKVFNGSVSDFGGFLWEEEKLDPASDNIDELLNRYRLPELEELEARD